MADFDKVFDEAAESLLQKVLQGGINQLFEANVNIDLASENCVQPNEILDEDPEHDCIVPYFKIRGKGRESNFTVNLIEDFTDDAQKAKCDSIFEYCKQKMVAIDESAKVLKRTVREGYGENLPGNSRVMFDYVGYLETDNEPFDSTLTHRRPYSLVLGRDNIIYGLELSLATMKMGETAQFWIHYEYAYGKYGVPDMIEPETDVFFEVHLYSYKDVDELDQSSVPYEDRNKYPHVLKTVEKLKAEAFTHVELNIDVALQKYLKAYYLLDNCSMKDYEEEQQRNAVLVKILADIAVCSNKLSQPKRACWACNRIYRLVPHFRETSAQVLYQNAKALVELEDYKMAYRRILCAAQKLPDDTDVKQQKFLIECLLKSRNESVDTLSLDFENMTFIETQSDSVEDLLPPQVSADLNTNCLKMANDETVNSIRVRFLEGLTEREFAMALDFVDKYGFSVRRRDDAVFLEKI